MAVEIRPLDSTDAKAFWKLRLEALESEPTAFAASADEHRATPMEEVARRLNPGQPESFILGAFADGQMVGTAGFARQDRAKSRHKGMIWGVYVASSHRARGLGRQLIAELLRRASLQPDLEQVLLTVSVEQAAARALYLSMGFEVFGRERHALKVGDAYVDEDYMMYVVPR